jgi:hypothetical protein
MRDTHVMIASPNANATRMKIATGVSDMSHISIVSDMSGPPQYPTSVIRFS